MPVRHANTMKGSCNDEGKIQDAQHATQEARPQPHATARTQLSKSNTQEATNDTARGAQPGTLHARLEDDANDTSRSELGYLLGHARVSNLGTPAHPGFPFSLPLA